MEPFRWGRSTSAAVGEDPGAGLDAGAWRVAHLIDLQEQSERYPAPNRRGALRRPFESERVGDRLDREYRAALAVTISRTSGIVVLTGVQGVGKSTLALDAARLHDHGFGWRLRGSSQRALDASLAENESFERGEPEPEGLEVPPKAVAALNRLRSSTDPWVVVVDNLAYDPTAQIPAWVKRLPTPRDGQVLIVTTNLPEEALPDAWRPARRIEALDPRSIPDIRISGVVQGSPMLFQAFRRLLEEHPERRDPSWAIADGWTTERALDSYWEVVRNLLVDDLRSRVEEYAFLPPDDLGDVPPAARERLQSLGLLSVEDERVQLHRLLGATVRRYLADEGAGVVARLLSRRVVREHLLRRADTEVTADLVKALATSQDGHALWALAAVQEIYQPASSVPTFKRAQALLNREDPRDRVAYADCLHAQARQVNQARNASLEGIDEAIGWVLDASSLRPDQDTLGRAKHRALYALLLKKGAAALSKDDPRRLQDLLSAASILEEGYVERSRDPAESPLVIDRASFNRAGVQIDLAQTDGSDVVAALRTAREVYGASAEFRRINYGSPNPVTAAALWGEGLAAYYTALLLDEVEDRRQLLAYGQERSAESLLMRQLLDNRDDVGKSAVLVAKCAALEATLAGVPVGELLAELAAELAT